MGRGLSDLQKWLLARARDNRSSEGLDFPRFRVFFPDPTAGLERGSLEWRLTLERYKGLGCLSRKSVWRVDDPDSEARLAKLLGNGAALMALAATAAGDEFAEDDVWPNGAYSPIYGADLVVGGAEPPETRCISDWLGESDARAVADRMNAAGIKATVRAETIDFADVYAWEAMGDFYGFSGHRKVGISGRPEPTHFPPREAHRWEIEKHGEDCEGAKVAGKRKVRGVFFDREAIGPLRYDAAKVSVSKAFARLESRKLAHRYFWRGSGSGLKLTPRGLDEAEQLSANHDDNITEVSQ